MAPDGAIDPHEAPHTGQRVQRESSLSFAILEFLNQFPLCFPLTQINSHLWRRRDKREEWDHLLEALRGKWRDCVFLSACPLFIYLFSSLLHMTVTNKLTMVDIKEIIPYFIWLKANRGKVIEALEQMDLFFDTKTNSPCFTLRCILNDVWMSGSYRNENR